MKYSYLGFKTGQKIILNESIVWDSIHYDKGMTGIIIDFPATALKRARTHFVHFMPKNNNYPVSCDIDKIIKA